MLYIYVNVITYIYIYYKYIYIYVTVENTLATLLDVWQFQGTDWHGLREDAIFAHVHVRRPHT